MEDEPEAQAPVKVSDAEKEIVRLWRAWKTMHEMMADRGYEVGEDDTKISLEDFKSKHTAEGRISRETMFAAFNPTQAMMLKHTPLPTKSDPDPNPTCGKAHVRFYKDAAPGIKQLRAYAQELGDGGYTTGVLITQQSLTPASKKLIPAVEPTIIELFLEQELVVNITHHNLVPKHVLLSPEEKKKLLERYRLKESQLPRIQLADPVARYLGLRRGNVVKIIRKSETAGRYASYRWCI